jgi:hypothetical protein
VNKAVWAMLTETEKTLLLATDRAALGELDEEDLLALHDRVRRARNKYSKLYRRRAREQVAKDATRERAHLVNVRTAAKVEAFEDVLARVSRQLARMAAATAEQLRAARLQLARRRSSPPRPRRARPAEPKGTARIGHEPRRTPASKRASAQARAATRRKQAARRGT